MERRLPRCREAGVEAPSGLDRTGRVPADGSEVALQCSRHRGAASVACWRTPAWTSRCASGEIVGLIGTNGAGKSTLMNAIGGFVDGDRARSSCSATELHGTSSAARARLGLGRTFQSARLFPELTVRETVQVALEARGRTSLLEVALFSPRASGPSEGRGPSPTSSSTSSASVATPTSRVSAAVDRNPPHRRARRTPGPRRSGAVPRRADRRRRPTRGRGHGPAPGRDPRGSSARRC